MIKNGILTCAITDKIPSTAINVATSSDEKWITFNRIIFVIQQYGPFQYSSRELPVLSRETYSNTVQLQEDMTRIQLKIAIIL